MPKISFYDRTLYYHEPEHTEVLGVVDGQGNLWLKDVPNGDTLCREGRYIGIRDKKIMNHARGWQAALRFGKKAG